MKAGSAGLRASPLLVLLILVATGHVLPVADHSVLYADLRDGMHPLAFAVTTFVWLQYFNRITTTRESRLRHLVPLLALAVVGEALQLGVGRDFSAVDLLWDGVGIVAGSWIWHRTASQLPVGFPTFPYDLACATALALPIALPANAIIERATALPSLTRFDTDWGRRSVRSINAQLRYPNATLQDQSNGGTFLAVDLQDAEYSGIEFHDPYPDWRGYTALSIELRAIGDYSELVMRVHDRHHDGETGDRFNLAFDVDHSRQRFCIPVSRIRDAPAARHIDLRKIESLAIFVAGGAALSRLEIFDVRLVDDRAPGLPVSCRRIA